MLKLAAPQERYVFDELRNTACEYLKEFCRFNKNTAFTLASSLNPHQQKELLVASFKKREVQDLPVKLQKEILGINCVGRLLSNNRECFFANPLMRLHTSQPGPDNAISLHPNPQG